MNEKTFEFSVYYTIVLTDLLNDQCDIGFCKTKLLQLNKAHQLKDTFQRLIDSVFTLYTSYSFYGLLLKALVDARNQ